LCVFHPPPHDKFVRGLAKGPGVESDEVARRNARNPRRFRDANMSAGMPGKEVPRSGEADKAIVLNEWSAHDQ
jgi:hypothetical protein